MVFSEQLTRAILGDPGQPSRYGHFVIRSNESEILSELEFLLRTEACLQYDFFQRSPAQLAALQQTLSREIYNWRCSVKCYRDTQSSTHINDDETLLSCHPLELQRALRPMVRAAALVFTQTPSTVAYSSSTLECPEEKPVTDSSETSELSTEAQDHDVVDAQNITLFNTGNQQTPIFSEFSSNDALSQGTDGRRSVNFRKPCNRGQSQKSPLPLPPQNSPSLCPVDCLSRTSVEYSTPLAMMRDVAQQLEELSAESDIVTTPRGNHTLDEVWLQNSAATPLPLAVGSASMKKLLRTSLSVRRSVDSVETRASTITSTWSSLVDDTFCYSRRAPSEALSHVLRHAARLKLFNQFSPTATLAECYGLLGLEPGAASSREIIQESEALLELLGRAWWAAIISHDDLSSKVPRDERDPNNFSQLSQVVKDAAERCLEDVFERLVTRFLGSDPIPVADEDAAIKKLETLHPLAVLNLETRKAPLTEDHICYSAAVTDAEVLRYSTRLGSKRYVHAVRSKIHDSVLQIVAVNEGFTGRPSP